MTTVEQVAVNRYKAEHKRGKSKFKHKKHVVEKAKPEQNQYTNTNLFRMMQMNLALAPSDSLFSTSLPDFSALTNPFAKNFNSPVHNEKQEVAQKTIPFKFKPKEAPADRTSTPAAKMPTFGRKATMLANQQYVEDIAKNINCDFQDLMAVIDIESGWKTDAKNPGSSASGLGQITDAPLKRINNRLGSNYTTKQLRNMSAKEQMPILKEYLVMSKKDAGFKSDHKLTNGELYCLFAAPANAKKQYLYKKLTKEYSQNLIWDVNKDGYIAIADLGEVVEKRASKIFV